MQLASMALPLCMTLLGETAPIASPHGPAPSQATQFSGHLAFEQVRQVVHLGPRSANSAGLEACRQHIREQVKALGLQLDEHPFEVGTPLGLMPMVNLSVSLPGQVPGKLVIAGHYDTKRFPFVFLGANDGGSSTGFLLELLRVLKDRPRRLGVEVVFFDGEEALREWTALDHTYGSREYVRMLKDSGSQEGVKALILVDMIGKNGLTLRRESHSTPWLTDLIWASARRLGHGRHFLDEDLPIEDDHVPFLAAGIPAVDLIDFDYPAWHTAGDTLDQLSPRSLQVVGDVLLDALPAIEQRLLLKP